MDVPSSWLVRPREALYDLDNIQLGSISPEDQSVKALFELDYLIIEGHAREGYTNAPPRGLQLQLVDSNSAPVGDTQVVANLGYFQFKSKPGVFRLEIRSGRGNDIFKMESVGNEGWDSPTVESTGSEITLTSFEGVTLYPRLSRRPGMEIEDVLAELQEPGTAEGHENFLNSVVSR
jgi:UDP-glucose:glycoprotein glucosyltransferase